MSSVRYLNPSTNDLSIQNRMISPKDELFQAITMMLRLFSPYDTLQTSVTDIMEGDISDIQSDVMLRIENLKKILQEDYGVRTVLVEKIEPNDDGDIIAITLQVIMDSGKIMKETVYA